MDIALCIGIAGATLILIAFYFNQTRKWSADDLVFDSVNFAGSLLMVIYSVLLESIPFLILNAIWALVSLKDILEHVLQKNKINN